MSRHIRILFNPTYAMSSVRTLVIHFAIGTSQFAIKRVNLQQGKEHELAGEMIHIVLYWDGRVMIVCAAITALQVEFANKSGEHCSVRDS
jgi:hypothetical protein